jgi:hypothetical protein
MAYLDPTILAECGDEEMRKVYELRQRTSKSEKWERKRCQELLALLSLKLDELDERGVLGITSLPYIFFFHASSTFCLSISPSFFYSTLSFFPDSASYPTLHQFIPKIRHPLGPSARAEILFFNNSRPFLISSFSIVF